MLTHESKPCRLASISYLLSNFSHSQEIRAPPNNQRTSCGILLITPSFLLFKHRVDTHNRAYNGTQIQAFQNHILNSFVEIIGRIRRFQFVYIHNFLICFISTHTLALINLLSQLRRNRILNEKDSGLFWDLHPLFRRESQRISLTIQISYGSSI